MAQQPASDPVALLASVAAAAQEREAGGAQQGSEASTQEPTSGDGEQSKRDLHLRRICALTRCLYGEQMTSTVDRPKGSGRLRR
jgi:hypothetical protein